MPAEPSTFEFLEPPQSEDEIGRLGPYSVIALIGEGGMGAVFKARDSRLKREVALKTMRKKWASSAIGRKRFVEEARAMAAVQHDNVATIFEVGIYEGTPFLAMEMLQGKPLNQLIKEKYRFTIDEVFRLADEVAAGLSAAHQRKIIHRDIKPANIWIESSSGRAKILDFGLAIAGGDFDRFTHRGSVLGSPAYLSPEQSRGESLDDRSDLYSLGIVLYQVCAGVPPLLCKKIPDQLIANICGQPEPLAKLQPDLPEPLCELVHQLLEKEPRNRPNSAIALQERIRDTKNQCNTLQNAALQIVTNNPPQFNEAEQQEKGPVDTTPKEKLKSTKSNYKYYSASAFVLACVVLLIFWNGKENRVANTPVKQRNTIKPSPKVVRITPNDLNPLKIKISSEDQLSFPIPGAALFKLTLENTAKSPSVDPKRLYFEQKVVAQVMTLLNPVESNEVLRPAFAIKFSPKRLPNRGATVEFDIQFLTNDLSPGNYNLSFELQTPNGQSIQRINQILTLTE